MKIVIYLLKRKWIKTLDNFKVERDKNLNFFKKLFKKDRMHEAAQALREKIRGIFRGR